MALTIIIQEVTAASNQSRAEPEVSVSSLEEVIKKYGKMARDGECVRSLSKRVMWLEENIQDLRERISEIEKNSIHMRTLPRTKIDEDLLESVREKLNSDLKKEEEELSALAESVLKKKEEYNTVSTELNLFKDKWAECISAGFLEDLESKLLEINELLLSNPDLVLSEENIQILDNLVALVEQKDESEDIKEDYVIEQICPLEPIEEPDKVSVAVHEVKSIIKKSGALERIRGFFSTPKKKSVTFNEAQEVMLIPRLFPPSLFAKTEDDSRAVMRRNLCRKFAN